MRYATKNEVAATMVYLLEEDDDNNDEEGLGNASMGFL